MKYRAVIFDYDYTLADSERAIVRCFRTVLAARGAAPTDTAIKTTIGRTLEEAFCDLLGEDDPDKLAALRREYVAAADRCMTAMTRFYPGALELLGRLRAAGVKTGVVSTKYRYRILQGFAAAGAEALLDDAVGGEDVAAHKPDPAGLLLWLGRNGVQPDAAVYVGDHVVDAEAARRAGVPFIGVAQGMTPREALAAYPGLGTTDRIGGVWEILTR